MPYINQGERLPYTPNSDLSVDTPVLMGTGFLFGVTTHDLTSGVEGTVDISGVFELPAVNDTAWDQGDILYWDVSAGKLDTDDDTGTNKQIGVASEDKATAAAVGRVKLNVRT